MKIRRGDVVIVLYPNSDTRTTKRRPALVVQANGLATGIPQTIIAMITTNLARVGHPSRVEVSLASPAAKKTGLKSDSVIALDNITTVHNREIAHVIGRWTDMPVIDAALRHTLGL